MDERKMKTLDDNFADWEGHVFGFGYGTGEEHTIPAVKRFLELCCGENNSYDYEVLQDEFGAVTAWLLINALCHADILEYGTSPRYAWLTEKGRALKAFTTERTGDDLVRLTQHDEHYNPCYPDACNCGPEGYEAGRKCVNPFW